jgi:hypothetical protein
VIVGYRRPAAAAVIDAAKRYLVSYYNGLVEIPLVMF